MPYTGVARGILKGNLGLVVQTRSMFTGTIVLTGTDTDFDVVSGYINSIFTPVSTYLSGYWGFTSLEIQHFVAPDWFTVDEQPYTFALTSGTEALANLVAVVLVAKAIGKRLIGRKFLAGITENYTVGNYLTAGAMAAFAQAAAAYVGTYTSPAGSTFTPGILGKDGAFHTFASGLLSPLIGTMRRRKPGQGI